MSTSTPGAPPPAARSVCASATRRATPACEVSRRPQVSDPAGVSVTTGRPPARGYAPGDTPCERGVPVVFSRRTKIVATLGPATDQPGVLDALVAAGIDCARLNCSHGTREDLRRRAAEVRSVAARADRSVGLLFDLQGPKLRLSAGITPVMVRAGDVVTFFAGSEPAPDRGIAVAFPDFPRLGAERAG